MSDISNCLFLLYLSIIANKLARLYLDPIIHQHAGRYSKTSNPAKVRSPWIRMMKTAQLGIAIIGSHVTSLRSACPQFDPYAIRPSSDGPEASNSFHPIPGQPANDLRVEMIDWKTPFRDRPPDKRHFHTESFSPPVPSRFDLGTTISLEHQA